METKSEVKGSLQIKNNIFYAVLDLKDKNGKRKLKWISTGLSVRGNKRKAEEALNQLKSEYSMKNATPEPQRIDFLSYLKTWLEIQKGSLQETTYDGYHMLIHGKIMRYFEPLELSMDEIQAPDIERFFDHMYKSGVTSNTVIHYYALLMTFFKYAKKKKKIIKENPMEDVDKPAEIQYMADFYSTQEVTAMFEAIKDDVLYTTIMLAAFYGLRRSEVLGVRWSAIDFERKIITINRKVIQTYNGGGSKANIKVSDRMKTKSSLRSFPLIPVVEEALLAEKKRQESYRKTFKNSYSSEYLDYVCVQPDGKLINPDYVSGHFPYLLKKHNLRVIRFHDLRHDYVKHATHIFMLIFYEQETQKSLNFHSISMRLPE